MLSDEELNLAFYYPGSGLDLQPLLRFSHLTNLFIYADPQYDEGAVIDRFSGIVRDPPFAGQLELPGAGRHISEQELGRTTRLPAGMRKELYEHENTRRRNFGPVRRPWAREFLFRRRIGNIRRELRLIYIAGEGLATYSALYGKNEVGPQFLCTIQTAWGGVNVPEALEAAHGIHERFLLRLGGPQVWIRGNWMGKSQRYRPRAEGYWNRCVQTYSGWQCIDYENQPVFADVAAFACQNGDVGLATNVVINGPKRRTVRLLQRPLDLDELRKFDAAFVSPRLYERFQRPLVGKFAVHQHGDGALPEVLDQIRQLAERHRYRRVVMTGRGYEDEGEYFRRWIGTTAWPESLEVRFEHDLDLADQRGLGSRDGRSSVAKRNLLTSINQD